MSFFVTADGGLTTAGYVGCVVLMVALVVIASVLSAQKVRGREWMQGSWHFVRWGWRWRL